MALAELDRLPAQGQQMQAHDQAQDIDVQCGAALGNKVVLLTPENMPEYPYLPYDPLTDRAEWLHALPWM